MSYATISVRPGGMGIQSNSITADGQAIQHVGHNIKKQINYYGRVYFISLSFVPHTCHRVRYSLSFTLT